MSTVQDTSVRNQILEAAFSSTVKALTSIREMLKLPYTEGIVEINELNNASNCLEMTMVSLSSLLCDDDFELMKERMTSLGFDDIL